MQKKIFWLFVMSWGGFFQCREADWEQREHLKLKVQSDACQINHRFLELRQTAGLLADFTAEVYRAREELGAGLSKSTYARYEGVLYKASDDGGSAVYYSNRTPIGLRETAKVRFTENLDLLFRPIQKKFPMVVQVYLNTFDSMNRIYPFFEVLSQYANDLDISKFNFYYLADSVHNPTREPVWVREPYIDPAGRGWMISAVAPVYVNHFLEGVVGIDVTISEVLRQFLGGTAYYGLFVNKSGWIMASDEETANLLDVPTPRPVQYLEAIRMDTYCQDDLHLLKSKNLAVREAAQGLLTNNHGVVNVKLANKHYLMVMAEIKDLDWLLVELSAIE
jgi:hypothetical protein